MTALPVPRSTLESLSTSRTNALAMYTAAYDCLSAAGQALGTARELITAAAPRTNRYNVHISDAKKHFLAGLELPDRDAFLNTARRIVDVDIWAHLVELTDLEQLMDKTAKDAFNRQLLTDPPEATEENIVATMTTLLMDADTIFKRGIATCFSALDRRFRSHDGWKIGSRVILDHAFNDIGSWNYYKNHRDTFFDIERTFFILDGKQPPPNYGGIVGAVEHARRGRFGPHQCTVESDYFTIRTFKNGNAHVWFKRDDLVAKANKLLAEYYGEVIPEEREPDPDTGFANQKTTPARYYGFYPTPDAAAQTAIERAHLYRLPEDRPLRVLEPSAGTGNLASRAAATGAIVDCVEIQPHLAADLLSSGRYRTVIGCDFLALQPPDPDNLYNRVIMNPPFDRERDIDHVLHALKFLNPDGLLIAIMSAGTEFRSTRKATAFRELMLRMKADFEDLPAGSFSTVGTNVNTILLKVWASGRPYHR